MKQIYPPSQFSKDATIIRTLCLLMALFLTFICATAQTFSYEHEGQTLNYKITGDTTVEVAKNSDISGDLIIPEEIVYNDATYSVTSIGNRAFFYCSSLTSVTIPESVTLIGTDAFYACSSLTSIIISESVTSIGDSAFNECSSLTSVTIPNSVTSIGYCAFCGCSSLTSITIPESVTSIGDSAFSYCSSLTSITIPASVTSIGDSTFSCCSSLTSIIIPESVTSIGKSAFSCCSSLKSITIPESVASIGDSAFSGCSSLTSITISESVNSIGNYAFSECSSLTSISIPNSVTSIGLVAFSGCSSLISIIIPESVTSIGELAFYGCSSLTSIIIPESVTSIGDYAFSCCSSLYLLKVKSDKIFVSDIDNVNTVFAIPASKVSEYKEAYPNNIVIPVDEVGFEPESYELAIKPSESKSLSLFIDAFENVNGFQMDVTLPEGLSIADEDGELQVSFGEGTAPESSSITASKVSGNNTYRIVAYSAKNEAFLAGENLLNIAIKADADFEEGEIKISNVMISTSDGEGYQGLELSIIAKGGIEFSIGEDITIEEDEILQLEPVAEPSIEGLTLEWSSTNPDVAYVDTDNVLHSSAPGETVITASNAEYRISASVNVTVTPVLYGDANDNGAVAIDDVVTDVHYILEKHPQPFSFKKADVNRDLTINILDVSKTVAIVLSDEATQVSTLSAHICSAAEPNASMSAENVRLDADGHAVMTLRLNGDADITALQGDIRLPDGMRVNNIAMAGEQKGDHIISFAELKSGATRFAVYSMSLSEVKTGSAFIDVEIESENPYAEGELSVDNLYGSDTACNLLRMAGINVGISGTSGVTETISNDNTTANIYNMQGILLLRNASADDIRNLTPGLYIINGKKVIVK